MISLAFYWSLTLSQFSDNKRKDFWHIFIHHAFTLLLLSLSWTCNMYRVGTLVLLVNDCANIFLEAWKSLRFASVHANITKAPLVAFILFVVPWIVTRLIILPYIISSCIQMHQQIRFSASIILISLLIGLLILNFIWTFMIYQMIQQAIQSGALKDVRSCSEDEVSDDESEITRKKLHMPLLKNEQGQEFEIIAFSHT